LLPVGPEAKSSFLELVRTFCTDLVVLINGDIRDLLDTATDFEGGVNLEMFQSLYARLRAIAPKTRLECEYSIGIIKLQPVLTANVRQFLHSNSLQAQENGQRGIEAVTKSLASGRACRTFAPPPA
jgi:hypothetical protein